MANTNDPQLRRAVWERDGGLCGFCGQPVPVERMELDHAVPRSLGGPTHELNLRPAHRTCNRAAGNRKPRHGQLPLAPSPDAVLYVRIPKPLRAALEAWADEEFLKVAPFVVQLLHKAVAQHKAERSAS